MSSLEGPRIGRWIIRILVPENEQEFILGDLEELYRERVERIGIGPARRRYLAMPSDPHSPACADRVERGPWRDA